MSSCSSNVKTFCDKIAGWMNAFNNGEPIDTNTAFNKNFGQDEGEVAEGSLLKHLYIYGINNWDSDTKYQKNSYTVGDDGKIYKSVIGTESEPNQGNNPLDSDKTKWVSLENMLNIRVVQDISALTSDLGKEVKVAIVTNDNSQGVYFYNPDLSDKNNLWSCINGWEAQNKNKRPQISLIFDDGLISTEEVANVLEEKGKRCGFAIHSSALLYHNSDYINSLDLLNFQSRGFEILSHSTYHPVFKDIGIGYAKQEIENNYNLLKDIGLDIRGFVTPSSVATEEQKEKIISNYFHYAYTQYSGDYSNDGWKHNEEVTYQPLDLGRGKIFDGVDGIDYLDEVARNKRLATFYEHDVVDDDIDKLKDFIDRAKELDIDIVTPYQLSLELAKRRGISLSGDHSIKYGTELLIELKSDSDDCVNTNSSYIFEASADGTFEFTPLEETGNIYVQTRDTYTTKWSFTSTTGTLVEVGFKKYDSDMNLIESDSISEIKCDSLPRTISHTVSKLVDDDIKYLVPFLKGDFLEGDSIRLAASTRKGHEWVSSGETISVTLPIQSFDIEHNTWTNIPLPWTDNPLFAINDNKIIARKNITLSGNITFSAQPNDGDALDRGVIKWTHSNGVIRESNMLVGDTIPTWRDSTTYTLKRGDAITLDVYHNLGVTYTINGNDYDSITINATI